MNKRIVRATVIGKSQNRTALGMMNAYLTMYPHTTIHELKSKFSKQNVCPDTGIKELFYTADEIEQEKSGANAQWFTQGNACFVKDGEWLTLGNGQHIAFNKVWTSSSLALLQQELAKYNIVATVDTSLKETPAGFSISYEYARNRQETEKQQGLSIWIWIIILFIIVLSGYFIYKAFA